MLAVDGLIRPPAPEPRPSALGLIGLVRALKKNPIECWANEHFEQPFVTAARALGHVVVINDPDAIRRVLLDNAANYRKDKFQRRVCSAGLADGLLCAEGEQWRAQRRAVAAMFSRRSVTSFAPAMQQAAVILATIMRHFVLEVVPRHAVWPLLRVTLRPAGGLPMTITARYEAESAVHARHIAA